MDHRKAVCSERLLWALKSHRQADLQLVYPPRIHESPAEGLPIYFR